MELRIPALQLAQLTDQLLESSPDEGAAFLSVRPSGGDLVLRSARVFDRTELEDGEYGELALSERAQIEELGRIKRGGHGLIEVHTHPLSGRTVQFSSFDDEQLRKFVRYIGHKLPGRSFGALVLSAEGYDGRTWTGEAFEKLTLRPVGEKVLLPKWAVPSGSSAIHPRFDRQVRALGHEGQNSVSALRVGVVGLGGTGSQVVQQLAHLGVREFVVIDPDRVDQTNLPRLAGATWWDVLLHRKKSFVARRQVRRVRHNVKVSVAGNLRSEAALRALTGVDLIVGSVDNDGARLILAELAAAHFIPYLDIGVGIDREESQPEIGGRVAFSVPGGPCLACADELDFAEAAEDLESPAQRTIRMQRGYARDRTVEPALMPLNTVLVGLAMVEILAYFTGVRPVAPFFRYDLVLNRIRIQNVTRSDDCAVCGPALGMGDDHGIERYVLSEA